MRLTEAVEHLLPIAYHGDAELLTRQIRYWSKLGLLGASDELQEDVRRHRRYADGHLYRAALLLELSRYGVGIRFFREIAEWLDVRVSDYRRKYGTDPFEDARRRIEVLVIFSPVRARRGGLTTWMTVVRGGGTAELPGINSWIVVNLSMLLAAI